MDDKLQVHDLRLNDVRSSGEERLDEITEDRFADPAYLVVDPYQRSCDFITIGVGQGQEMLLYLSDDCVVIVEGSNVHLIDPQQIFYVIMIEERVESVLKKVMIVLAFALGHEISKNALNLPQDINADPVVELSVEMVESHLLFDEFLHGLIPSIHDLMRFHPVNALNKHGMG